MTRLLILLIATTSLMVLTGCKNQNPNPGEEISQPYTEEGAQDEYDQDMPGGDDYSDEEDYSSGETEDDEYEVESETPSAPEGTQTGFQVDPEGVRNCNGRELLNGIPNRQSGAASGSAFTQSLSQVSGRERDRFVVSEILNGNIPEELQSLHPVVFSEGDVEITVCVFKDYLAVGNDNDKVRVPMGMPAARQIASTLGFLLPTKTMVDAIYNQAQVKLSPSPMTPGPQMSSTAYFVEHNQTIEASLGNMEGLVAGHKKDLVLTNRLNSVSNRVAIYGWHRSNGTPIQPLSTVHGEYYADYSHGVRLVSQIAFVNGQAQRLSDLLRNPQYASILNGSEGALAENLAS